MKETIMGIRRGCCRLRFSLWLLLLPAVLWADDLAEQAIRLHGGWNAVYIHVQPDEETDADLLNAICGQDHRILGVWTFSEASGPEEFNDQGPVADPGTWLRWFPPAAERREPRNRSTGRARWPEKRRRPPRSPGWA